MPRRDRTFSADDILRLIDRNLTAVERAEVVFSLLQAPVKDALGGGPKNRDQDSDLERLIRILGTKGIKPGGR